MSGERTTCDDFLTALVHTLPPVHPAAATSVAELLDEAYRASRDGHTVRVVRLMEVIRTQVAYALHQEADVAKHLGDELTAMALREHANSFDPDAGAILHPPDSDERNPEPGEPTMAETRALNVPPVTAFEEKAPAPAGLVSAVMNAAQTPTPDRLAKAHQLVVLKNFSEVGQTHVIQDRHLRYIPLQPGEQREVDMVLDELQNLMYQARTDRGFYTSGPHCGKAFPPHPLRVVGMQKLQEGPALR